MHHQQHHLRTNGYKRSDAFERYGPLLLQLLLEVNRKAHGHGGRNHGGRNRALVSHPVLRIFDVDPASAFFSISIGLLNPNQSQLALVATFLVRMFWPGSIHLPIGHTAVSAVVLVSFCL